MNHILTKSIVQSKHDLSKQIETCDLDYDEKFQDLKKKFKDYDIQISTLKDMLNDLTFNDLLKEYKSKDCEWKDLKQLKEKVKELSRESLHHKERYENINNQFHQLKEKMMAYDRSAMTSGPELPSGSFNNTIQPSPMSIPENNPNMKIQENSDFKQYLKQEMKFTNDNLVRQSDRFNALQQTNQRLESLITQVRTDLKNVEKTSN